MDLCLLNLLILIDCFLCNSYPCVLFESLSHVINPESHVYSWNLGKIYLVHYLKFWSLPCFTRRFQNFKKVTPVNSSQISLLNMQLLVQITVPMVFSSFNSINGFSSRNSNQVNTISNNANGIQSTKMILKIIQYFKKSHYLREFYSFKKPTPLNLMRQVEGVNLMQPVFSPMDFLIPAEF